MVIDDTPMTLRSLTSMLAQKVAVIDWSRAGKRLK